MATIEECRAALDRLSDSVAGAEGAVGRAAALDRSLSCHLTDLGTTFLGRLRAHRLEVTGTVPGPPPGKPQIRITTTSDDLLALVDGELHFARAWAAGSVRLDASLRDLLRLRTLL